MGEVKMVNYRMDEDVIANIAMLADANRVSARVYVEGLLREHIESEVVNRKLTPTNAKKWKKIMDSRRVRV